MDFSRYIARLQARTKTSSPTKELDLVEGSFLSGNLSLDLIAEIDSGPTISIFAAVPYSLLLRLNSVETAALDADLVYDLELTPLEVVSESTVVKDVTFDVNTGGTGKLKITSSVAIFTSADVGRVLHIADAVGTSKNLGTYVVDSFVSTTVVIATKDGAGSDETVLSCAIWKYNELPLERFRLLQGRMFLSKEVTR